MFRALSDAPDAVKMYEARKNIGYFDGNGQANTYAWIYALNDLGDCGHHVSPRIARATRSSKRARRKLRRLQRDRWATHGHLLRWLPVADSRQGIRLGKKE